MKVTRAPFFLLVGFFLFGCSYSGDKLDSKKNEELKKETKEYEIISAGMESEKVKKLIGEPTDVAKDGNYEMWIYYRPNFDKIPEKGEVIDTTGGSFTVTLNNGIVEEVTVLLSDLRSN